MSNVLPFYLLCDQSASMSGDPLATVNSALEELHAEIGVNPVVSDKTRFGVIGFSDTAEVVQPLADMSDIDSLPELGPKGGTSYAAAFETLRTEIQKDVAQLKAEGHRVYRPCAFFLSDGQPTDRSFTWLAALSELTDSQFDFRPNILAFGIGDADPAIIGQVGNTRAFRPQAGVSPVLALKEFARALTQSIIASTSTPDRPQLIIPETPTGFVAIDTDEI